MVMVGMEVTEEILLKRKPLVVRQNLRVLELANKIMKIINL